MSAREEIETNRLLSSIINTEFDRLISEIDENGSKENFQDMVVTQLNVQNSQLNDIKDLLKLILS
jgi:hypothetical protein